MDSTSLVPSKGGVKHQDDERMAGAHGVLVWDLPTRIFHVLLVALLAAGWATAEGAQDGGIVFVLHKLSGYGLATALLFRLVWGIGGSRRSRFSDFVRRWRDVRDYTRRLLDFTSPRTIGHSPLGGWMVIALLAVISLVLASGLISAGDDVAGPLADRVPRWIALVAAKLHGATFDFLLVLAVLHVVGVLGASFLHRENLTRSMWNGRKLLPERQAREEEETVAPGWGLVVALVAAAVVGFSLM